MNYPLKAADSLQLAAAWTWCSGDVQRCTFLSGDAQLVEAAQQVGFQVVMVCRHYSAQPGIRVCGIMGAAECVR
ncbi:MAG: hypothetical protein ACRYFU_01575 [Janthinobacterium lividum]